MPHVGILSQHFLVFFLIVLTPLWDCYEIPRLRASTEPRKKTLFYRKIITASWSCAIVATLAIGLMPVFAIHKVLGEIAWLDAGSRGGMVVEGIAAGMLIAILLPAVLALTNEKIRAKGQRRRRS